jgi:hypothetical protein
MHVYIHDDAYGRGSTSYLDEQPLDQQSQCTHIPWSQVADAPDRRHGFRHWADKRAANDGLPVYQMCLSQYEASTRV